MHFDKLKLHLPKVKRTLVLYVCLFVSTISGRASEYSPFSNDVLKFIDFMNTCTKHMFLDLSDETQFQDYIGKLHQSESTSPSILTLVSLDTHINYYNSGAGNLYSLPDISNVPKYTECVASIYFISQIISVKPLFGSHLFNLNHFDVLNIHEISTFKVVVASEFTVVDFMPSHFPYFDGPIFEIYNKFYLNMICSHCYRFHTPVRSFEPTLFNLNTYWNSVHKNQNGYLLGIRSNLRLKFNYTDTPSLFQCEPWPFIGTDIISKTPVLCSIFSFATQYNFTVANAYQNNYMDFLKTNLNLRPFFPTYEVTFETYKFSEEKKVKGSVYLHLQRERFQFIVVLDSNEIAQTNKNALLTSMDQFTWLFSIFSLFAISLTLYYFNIIVNEQNVFHVLISIFGTLINQGMSLPKITLPLLLTYGVWSLVTIVITNGYAGLLLSLLSKPTIPYVPNELAGILNSPLNLDFGTFFFCIITKRRRINNVLRIPPLRI